MAAAVARREHPGGQDHEEIEKLHRELREAQVSHIHALYLPCCSACLAELQKLSLHTSWCVYALFE